MFNAFLCRNENEDLNMNAQNITLHIPFNVG